MAVAAMSEPEEMQFKFNLPRLPAKAVRISVAEAERALLEKLASTKDDPTQAMWQLAQLYKGVGQGEKATAILRGLLKRVPGLEMRAQIVLALGQGRSATVRRLPGVSTPSPILLPPGTQFPSRSQRDRSKVAGRFNARYPALHSFPVAERRSKSDLATRPTKGTPSCESATATTVSSRVKHRSFACFACSAVRPPGIGVVGRWNGMDRGRGVAPRRGSKTCANRGLKRHGYPRWVAPRLLRRKSQPDNPTRGGADEDHHVVGGHGPPVVADEPESGEGGHDPESGEGFDLGEEGGGGGLPEFLEDIGHEGVAQVTVHGEEDVQCDEGPRGNRPDR
jgi:hypothetical protein